jgi:hypothetical protein
MKSLAVCLLVLYCSSVSAAFHCTVDVNRVLVYSSGAVNVNHTGRNDFTYICNLRQEWKGIDIVTCAMWTGMLQNTQNNDKKAIFYYNGEGSCTNLPTYSNSPAPVYIGSVK